MVFVALACGDHGADEPGGVVPEEGFVGGELEGVDLLEAFDEAVEVGEGGIEFGVVVEYPSHGAEVPDVVAVGLELAVGKEPGLTELAGFAQLVDLAEGHGKGGLEEECVFGFGDDVDVDFLSDDFHGLQVVGGDGDDEDAVLVVVAGLDLREVVFDLFEGGGGEVGEEDGFLDTGASLAFEVFDDLPADAVAFDIVHYKE